MTSLGDNREISAYWLHVESTFDDRVHVARCRHLRSNHQILSICQTFVFIWLNIDAFVTRPNMTSFNRQ